MNAGSSALGLGILISLRDEASGVLEKIQKKMSDFKGSSKDMTDSFLSGAKQFMGGFGLMVAGGFIINSAFAEPIRAATSFQSVMADVNKVANFSTQEYKEMSDSLVNLSKNIPMAADELGAIMAAAAQAGIAKKDLVAFTEDAAKMGVAFGIPAEMAGDAMAGLRSIFALSQKDVVLLGDSVNHLSNNMNATASNILDFLNRSGGIGRQAGMSAEQIAALGATFIDLKTPPETASRAISSLIMKLTTASTAGKDAQSAFKALGLSGSGIEKAFRQDATAGISTFLDAVNKSKDPIGALKSIVGEGFADDLAKLASGSDKLKNALVMVGNGALYAGSMLEEYATRANTVDNAMSILSQRMDAIKLRIGNGLLPVFGGLVNVISAVVLWVSNLPEPIYHVITLITGLTSVALVLAGALMIVGGFMEMWPVILLAMKTWLVKVKSVAIATTHALVRMALPVLALIALSYAVRRAYEKNFGGIRDLCVAVTAGFQMAAAAGTDGVARVSATTVKKLQELGLWDFAIIAGKVFYRARLFLEGFVIGFKSFFKSLKTGYTILSDFFDPVLTTGKDALELLGFLDGTASSNSKTWKEWGKIIGTWTPFIIGIAAAFKVATIAVAIFNAACTPIVLIPTLIIGAIALMIYHWDFFGGYIKAFWNGLLKMISGVFMVIKGLWQMLWGLLTLDLNLFQDGFKSVFDGIAIYVEGVIAIVGAALTPILDSINWVLEKMGLISGTRHNKALMENIEQINAPDEVKKQMIGATAGVDAVTAERINKQIQDLPPERRRDPKLIDALLASERSTGPKDAPSASISAQSAGVQTARTNAGIAQSAQIQPVVDNKVDVKVEPAKTDIYLDGEKVGQATLRYMERQDVRAGGTTR